MDISKLECTDAGRRAMSDKPLGRKNYGSILHLPVSRTGPGDHTCHEGQARIATEERRDDRDFVWVTEKLDGSNVGVALKDGVLYPLTRAGCIAMSSPWQQHRLFHEWVLHNEDRFRAVLNEGERLVGEWLMQAHGTRYDLTDREPFVAFDLMRGAERDCFLDLEARIRGLFDHPTVLWAGDPIDPESVMWDLNERREDYGVYGYHGALEPVEGAVWRVERYKKFPDGTERWVVDFLTKYVRPNKVDGKYFDDEVMWNITPKQLRARMRG